MKADVFVRKVAGLLPEGRLLLCISGGADSTALLRACVAACRDCIVVHCDFHLRGDESERDRLFVEHLCKRFGVEVIVEHFDVETYMKEHGVSIEMACRELRYAAFRRLKAEYGCSRIVVAHNRDDNDETMLLNLFRGTGVRGLCGMSADTGEILRPMLDISRREIEDYLSDIGQSYIIDSSNHSTDFRRNFIRHELLPLIATRWPGINKSLERTRHNLQACNELCEAAAVEALKGHSDFIPRGVYDTAPSRSVLLTEWLHDLVVSPSQIDEMSAGFRVGRRWRLTAHDVVMCREGLRIYEHKKRTEPPVAQVKCLPLTAEVMAEIKASRGEELLYYNGEELHFRTPRKGDRMAPLGMRGTKLVSDLLKEGGIPVHERDSFYMAVDSKDRIIWLPGLKRSRFLTVKEGEDKNVWCMSLK